MHGSPHDRTPDRAGRGRVADPLRATVATTLVPAPADRVWTALAQLVETLPKPRVLLAEAPLRLTHAVDGDIDGAADCWLSWTLGTAAGGSTRVTLRHCEMSEPAPPAELDEVLLLLLGRCGIAPPSASPLRGPEPSARSGPGCPPGTREGVIRSRPRRARRRR